ncbi:MAG: ImmA/IrrE family metallo-endopeptidase [Polyangiaceae bacterium]|nr:ImmA/IrrE family metallo-endopeptidase [Polyangiaceae bacterium]
MLGLRRRYINELAEWVRRVLDLRSDDFPVDVKACIFELGGELVEGDQPAEAKVEKVGNSFRITVRRGMPARRERFSIAHEIGHLFLHMGYYVDMEKWESIEEAGGKPMMRFGFGTQENEANEFAAALLMPRDVFRDRVAKLTTPNGMVSLQPLADHFGVSTDAARTRGQWLGLFYWEP